MYQAELAEITKGIIHSAGISEEISAAKRLSAFYARFSSDNALHTQKHNEVLLAGGIALSSYDAAICMDEYIRTARFIKGTYRAIVELLQRFNGGKLNVLYAGCGPYATLILPLLPLFGPGELNVLMIDINDNSLRSVSGLLKSMGLEAYSTSLVQQDAMLYKAPPSWPIHLLVSETMFHALIREPQVSITRHLAPQLHSGGLLIPEEIRLDMVYTFFGKEPYLQHGEDRAKKEPYPNRMVAGRLFSINKELAFFKEAVQDCQFESALYELPEVFSEHPDLCIFTSLTIYKDITLEASESSITNPYCVTSCSNLQSPFMLVYDFKEIPQWTYQ